MRMLLKNTNATTAGLVFFRCISTHSLFRIMLPSVKLKDSSDVERKLCPYELRCADDRSLTFLQVESQPDGSLMIAHGVLGDRVFNVPCELAFTEPVEKSRTLFFFQLCTVLAAAVSLDHRFPCTKPVLRRLRLRKDIRP